MQALLIFNTLFIARGVFVQLAPTHKNIVLYLHVDIVATWILHITY